MECCLALHLILSVFVTSVYGGRSLCQDVTQGYTGRNGGPDRHGLYLHGEKGHGVLVKKGQKDRGGNLSGDLT